MDKTNKKYALALLFLTACWFGMIVAVSMEATLRPKTPELLPEHKGLMFVMTRTIFEFFQKAELLFCVLMLFLSSRIGKEWWRMVYPFLVFALCVAESFLFMPILAHRSSLYFQGIPLPPSNIHFYTVAAEGLKLVLLILIFLQVGKFFLQNLKTEPETN
ncbi:MAG: hypothetical protein K1X82_13250 [Bacteroidia bacterium]|nr:hypothetical protein [Bacteroidia bacterium]